MTDPLSKMWRVRKTAHTPRDPLPTGGVRNSCVGEGNWCAQPGVWQMGTPFQHFNTHAEALRFALVASRYGVPLAKLRQAKGCTHPVDRACA